MFVSKLLIIKNIRGFFKHYYSDIGICSKY